MQYVTEQVFLTAAPDATNQFGFEEFNLALGTGTGPLNTFTEIGYVTFNTNPNYTQQVIDGFNIGQSNNNVYVTNAADHSLTLADITFGGGGVDAVGFDLKSTANASTTGGGAQDFFVSLYNGTTLLNPVPYQVTAPPGGTMFLFTGYTSTTPITELKITSTNLSPNLDLALDNFDVAAPSAVPEPATWLLLGLGGLGSLGMTLLRRRRA